MLTLKCTINLKSVSSASFFTPITRVQERMDKGNSTHVHVQCFFLLSTSKYIYVYHGCIDFATLLCIPLKQHPQCQQRGNCLLLPLAEPHSNM